MFGIEVYIICVLFFLSIFDMVCVIVDIDVIKVFNYMAGSNSISVQYERVA